MPRTNSQRDASRLFVQSIRWETPQKIVRLSDGRSLTVSVSSCVGEDDAVIERRGAFYVPCLNGDAQLLPLYLASDTLRCGGIILPVTIKEIETKSEYKSYQQLSEFHYRGHGLHGRTSILVATTSYPLLPTVLGYIQLATPFFMNKCRATLIDSPFECGPVSWKKWDKTASRSYINVFVRIARAVVHPEFRGLGLGQLLVHHGLNFARTHWHVANLKPIFLEIVADMLKFVPFPERAGMHFIGLTQGNLHRVGKDMAYLISQKKRVFSKEVAREDSVGVVDLQVAYMNKAIGLVNKFQLGKGELRKKLERMMESMTLEDYEQMQSILRLPKPSFMRGIAPEAEQFVRQRLSEIRPVQPKSSELIPLRPLKKSITLSRLSIHYTSVVARTKKTQTVQKAFGVNPGSIKTTVVKNLDLTIKPKEIVLIVGASGSGKTTLVELFADRGKARKNTVIEGNCFMTREMQIGILEPVRSTQPLIQLIGGNDTYRSLHVLNIAGLTEAFLYFKRFDQLSSGQKYRLMLARLIDTGANFWLADEFCSALDEITASIVAHNLQRHARRMGATVVVAAPHYENFIRSLRPDKVLKLSSAWEWRLYSGAEFMTLAAQSALQERAHVPAAAS